MSFVYMDEVKDALESAYQANENIILFGKGGYGKSEFSLKFFQDKGVEPFIKTMGGGTTIESVLGGVDISKIKDIGTVEYLVENSFMNYEYVIFEELLDAPGHVLEVLKDILTSGKLRNGSQVFEIKTKMIVCCTNRTRQEFSTDDSLKALMERFPMEIRVEWDNHSEHAYRTLLDSVIGKGKYDDLIPSVLDNLHTNNVTISPRTAVKAAKAVKNSGMKALKYFAGFSSCYGMIEDCIKAEEGTKQALGLFNKFMTDIGVGNNYAINNLSDIGKIKGILKKAKTIRSQVTALNLNDKNLKRLESQFRDVNKEIERMEQSLAEVIE